MRRNWVVPRAFRLADEDLVGHVGDLVGAGSPHVLCMGRAFFMLTVRYKTEIIYERIY